MTLPTPAEAAVAPSLIGVALQKGQVLQLAEVHG
jgi:hypothetical protein